MTSICAPTTTNAMVQEAVLEPQLPATTTPTLAAQTGFATEARLALIYTQTQILLAMILTCVHLVINAMEQGVVLVLLSHVTMIPPLAAQTGFATEARLAPRPTLIP